MRISIVALALALGAQAGWAQDGTDPAQTDTGTVTEETVETTDATDGEGGGADGSGETEAEVAEDTGEGAEAAEWHDNRSPTGQWNGGHRGSVSTMARAGLGPVFGALKSQGYGNIAISEADGRIFVSAERAGETRSLVYDAGTGAMLSDVTEASSSGNLIERMVDRVRQEPMARGRPTTRAKDARPEHRGGGWGKGSAMRGGPGGGWGKGSTMRASARGDAGGPGRGGGRGGGNGGGKGRGGGKNR